MRRSATQAVTFWEKSLGTVSILVPLAMDPPPAKKARKPRTIKPYATRPGPKGQHLKNRLATSAQPLKKVKEHLINSEKLGNGALTVGSCDPELSNLCRKFRVELRRSNGS